jgi:hypothetical protein
MRDFRCGRCTRTTRYRFHSSSSMRRRGEGLDQEHPVAMAPVNYPAFTHLSITKTRPVRLDALVELVFIVWWFTGIAIS